MYANSLFTWANHPRAISKGFLPKYAGQRVAVVGKVKSQVSQSSPEGWAHDHHRLHPARILTRLARARTQDNGMATLQCSDGQDVEVAMIAGSTYGEYVEVVGIANADGSASLREERACDMGNNFDLDSYEQLVQFANGKFSYLFS